MPRLKYFQHLDMLPLVKRHFTYSISKAKYANEHIQLTKVCSNGSACYVHGGDGDIVMYGNRWRMLWIAMINSLRCSFQLKTFGLWHVCGYRIFSNITPPPQNNLPCPTTNTIQEWLKEHKQKGQDPPQIHFQSGNIFWNIFLWALNFFPYFSIASFSAQGLFCFPRMLLEAFFISCTLMYSTTCTTCTEVFRSPTANFEAAKEVFSPPLTSRQHYCISLVFKET